MNDLNSLDQLRPIADEMLGGLHADERMRLAIKRAAAEKPKDARRRSMRLAPAICCAALALCVVGAAGTRLNAPAPDAGVTTARSMPGESAPMARMMPETVEIETIAAGENPLPAGEMVADLGDHAMVRRSAPGGETLFAAGENDIPLVALGSAVYQLLNAPQEIGSGLLAGEIGSVQLYDEQPSLASPAEMQMGLSNICEIGTAVYAVSGMADSSMIAAEVDGRMRVFQRVSYAGRGPAGASLEDTFAVRGKVKSAALSGVGELEGEAANAAIDVLLDNAALKSVDATARRQTLTVTLDNGLQLQLGVSGDTLCACGGWSCPEFFEAFEAAL